MIERRDAGDDPEEFEKALRSMLDRYGATVVEFTDEDTRDSLRVPAEARVDSHRHLVTVHGTDLLGVQRLHPGDVAELRRFEGWGYETTKTYHRNGTPVEVRIRVGDEDAGEASAGDRKVAHDNVLDALGQAFEWDERKIPDGGR